jgi:microcystin-dependent protein
MVKYVKLALTPEIAAKYGEQTDKRLDDLEKRSGADRSQVRASRGGGMGAGGILLATNDEIYDGILPNKAVTPSGLVASLVDHISARHGFALPVENNDLDTISATGYYFTSPDPLGLPAEAEGSGNLFIVIASRAGSGDRYEGYELGTMHLLYEIDYGSTNLVLRSWSRFGYTGDWSAWSRTDSAATADAIAAGLTVEGAAPSLALHSSDGINEAFFSSFVFGITDTTSGKSMSMFADGLHWGSGGTASSLSPETPTAARSLVLPDRSGTLSTTDQLPVAATETQAGILPLAATSEAVAGTDATKAVTPAGVKAAIDAIPASSGSPTGAVTAFAGATAPSGWLLCDGAEISRTTYATLFATIGTAYGAGNGSSTFNVPNMKGRVPVGRDATQTEFDTLGEAGGAKTHTLTEVEMPSHTHDMNAPINTIRWFGTGGNASLGAGTTVQGVNVNISATGGGGAHNNLQPYLTLNHIIKT